MEAIRGSMRCVILQSLAYLFRTMVVHIGRFLTEPCIFRSARASRRAVSLRREPSTMSADTTLTCRDCGQAFRFTSGEQDFYASRGFSEPGRCADCRAARKAQRMTAGRHMAATADRRTAAARLTRNVQRDLLELRPGGSGAVSTQRRQACLLLELLRKTPRQHRSIRGVVTARARVIQC